jgi:PAS domain S-box-containing protein
MRREGFAGFRIRQLGPNPGDRFVIQYVAPMLDPNAPMLGLDIASAPARREAALAAVASGEPRLSAPFVLEDDPNRTRRGFALIAPVYRSIATPAPAQRDAEAFGWATVRLVMDEVLRDFDREDGAFALALADVTPPGAPQPFFASPDWRTDPGVPVRQVRLQPYGRVWQLQVQALPPFTAQLHQRDPVALALRGAALTVLLALLLHAVLRSAQRERVILHQRARMAAMVDSAHDAIVGHTPEGVILSWNAAAERLLGWRETEVRGRELLALTVPAELREPARAALERVRGGQDVPPFDTVRLDRHGDAVDVSASVAGIRDEAGGLVGMATTLRDMRAQRAAQTRIEELNATLERQVRLRTAELRAILHSAATAIIATDLTGRITAFNPAAEAMLRLPAAQALGRSVLDFHDPQELRDKTHLLPREVVEHAGQLPPDVREALRRSRPPPAQAQRSEWSYVRADGTRFPGLLHLSVLRDDHGRVHGFLAVIADLSERKALEQALELRTHQAEAASQAKSAFLTHMSHELHTPLNAVIGLSQLLAQMELPLRAQQFVHHVRQAGEQLLALTNDVLDFSRLEAGELRLEPVTFELPALLEAVRARVQPLAAVKGLVLRLQAAPGLPVRLRGDAKRLRQVLLHLLDNAVKFTETGEVVLRVEAEALEARRVRLRLEVSDTGIGIAPAAQQRIFEPFAQGDDSSTRRFGGTGLGLSIVRRLVALMGGELWLDSAPGRGSRFVVTVELDVEDTA